MKYMISLNRFYQKLSIKYIESLGKSILLPVSTIQSIATVVH